jgi:uncharacterized protein (TIGR03643 family)
MEHDLICHYSDLPAPLAYLKAKNTSGRTLTAVEIDRIIEMAWEDRTPFDAITHQFGLNEQAVRNLMKKELKPNSYRRWRERVEACQTKHLKLRSTEIKRFKCNRQRIISNNNIAKR